MTGPMTVVLVALGLIVGGWMVFDGTRRLAKGDYVRIAGQLGPWTHAVRAVRLDPMSPQVAILHLACGAAQLGAAASWLFRHPHAATLSLVAAILSLWYLPFGTLASLATLGILFFGGRGGS